MIIYELQCPLGHQFEGWFRNNEAFEEQQRQDLVQCAVCGAGGVERLAVGGHLQKSERRADPVPAKTTAAPVQPKAELPVDPITLLKAIHHHVKTTYTDVGAAFPDQAIAMHRGEAPMRAIYGSATVEGKTQLDEAGVEYLPIPDLPETVKN